MEAHISDRCCRHCDRRDKALHVWLIHAAVPEVVLSQQIYRLVGHPACVAKLNYDGKIAHTLSEDRQVIPVLFRRLERVWELGQHCPELVLIYQGLQSLPELLEA